MRCLLLSLLPSAVDDWATHLLLRRFHLPAGREPCAHLPPATATSLPPYAPQMIRSGPPGRQPVQVQRPSNRASAFLKPRTRGVRLPAAIVHVHELEHRIAETGALPVVTMILRVHSLGRQPRSRRRLSGARVVTSAPIPYVLVASNDDKWREAQRILGRSLDRVTLDLDEIQAATTGEVALHKAREAFLSLGRPVIVEDAGVELAALGGFPGPRSSTWEKLAGPAWISAATDGLPNTRVETVCALAVCSDDRTLCFFDEAVVVGRLLMMIPPRDGAASCGDAIFVPAGDARPSLEMISAAEDLVSHASSSVRGTS